MTEGFSPPSGHKHIIFSWLLFSLLYWVAAWWKPFNIHELYSWVYVERCSLSDILLLREFGIGHPPLYHALQKLVQIGHLQLGVLSVRLVNYLAGSLFVIIFGRILLRKKHLPLFVYGMASSSVVLNTFVFSRMWGLVLCCSTLLLLAGENYLQNRSRKNLAAIFICFFLGLIADYGFILLGPYTLLLLSSGKTHHRITAFVSTGLLCVSAFVMQFISRGFQGMAEGGVYGILVSVIRGHFLFGHLVVNFYYWELYVVGLGILVGTMVMSSLLGRDGQGSLSCRKLVTYFSLIVLFCSVSYMLLGLSVFRLRHLAPVIFVIFGLLLVYAYRFLLRSREDEITLVFGIFGAGLLLMTVDSIFWRNLWELRFLQILIPFIFVLIYETYGKAVIHTLAVLLLATGLLYLPSNVVGWYYAPTKTQVTIPVIYENEFAYATDYFYSQHEGVSNPIFTEKTSFYEWCRVCEMGSNVSSNANFLTENNRFGVVCRDEYDPSERLPRDFKIVEKKKLYSELDVFFLHYLTPIEQRRYQMIILQR